MARLALARKMRAPPGHHAIMAQRYSDWAQQQLDRANRTLNPKARNDRLALAEYYLQLAEQERAAVKRLEPAVVPPRAFSSIPQELLPSERAPSIRPVGSAVVAQATLEPKYISDLEQTGTDAGAWITAT
jgi:hypothetical protein